MSRLPHDAFDYYFSLGADRSYEAVAARYQVSKRTVTRRAKAETWRRRIEKLELEVRERADQKLVETMGQMTDRHLKAVKVVQAKSLEALRTMSLTNAMDAIRALDLAIKQERTIRGEPSERRAVSLEETIKREMREWLTVDSDADEGPEEEEED